MIRFVKSSEVYFYKNSYKQANWEEVQMKEVETRRSAVKNLDSINTKLAYNSTFPLATRKNKKKDLQSLLTSNIVPNY